MRLPGLLELRGSPIHVQDRTAHNGVPEVSAVDAPELPLGAARALSMPRIPELKPNPTLVQECSLTS